VQQKNITHDFNEKCGRYFAIFGRQAYISKAEIIVSNIKITPQDSL
jgi:hypothetical protein